MSLRSSSQQPHLICQMRSAQAVNRTRHEGSASYQSSLQLTETIALFVFQKARQTFTQEIAVQVDALMIFTAA